MSTTQKRPEWNEIWMSMAHNIARRSIDPAFQVGCIIVTQDNQQILALGYNGMERGGANSVDSLERGKSGCIHAEINSLVKLDYNNPKRKIVYVTLSPCLQCFRLLINAGIDEVVYDNEYRDTTGLKILRNAGIKVTRFQLEPDS